MITFEQKQLLKRIIEVDTRSPKPPDDAIEKEAWFSDEKHLELLRANAKEGELIVFAQTKNLLVNSIIVRKSQLIPLDLDDMLEWQGNAYTVRAGYAINLFEDTQVKLEYGNADYSNNTFRNAEQLVFVRDSGGIAENDHYCEILQEYIHASDVFWCSNRSAYCRYDELGELIPVVTITNEQGDKNPISLVSFKRESLERYITVTDSVLVQMFEVMIYDESNLHKKDDSITFNHEYPSNDFFYKQLVDPGVQTWTKGVQIVYPVVPRPIIFSSIVKGKFSFEAEKYEKFIALDFRNGRLTEVSTDPSATTNYFVAENNSLPFETSPAFFRAEVLQKYKGNPDKYRVSDKYIDCRNVWSLEYGINDAEQVFAYIYKLRGIPYQEQLHWKSCNERLKTGISERTYKTDFLGEWPDDEEATPLENIRNILQKWSSSDSSWWKLRRESLLDSVTMPHGDNSEEWGKAFKKLSILIMEGFNQKYIEKVLRDNQISIPKNPKSLMLIEKLLNRMNLLENNTKLDGLKTAQKIRSKVDAHFTGSEGEQLMSKALQEHGSYASHFEHVCRIIVDDLKLIEKAFTSDRQS